MVWCYETEAEICLKVRYNPETIGAPAKWLKKEINEHTYDMGMNKEDFYVLSCEEISDKTLALETSRNIYYSLGLKKKDFKDWLIKNLDFPKLYRWRKGRPHWDMNEIRNWFENKKIPFKEWWME
jgi:hypothetical protein